MDYKILSDEEIVQAIKGARKVTSEDGKSLNITAIQGALDVMVEEKMKKMEKDLIKESIVEQNNEEMQFDYDSYKGYCSNKIADIYKVASDLCWKKFNGASVGTLTTARKGAIKGQYLSELRDSLLRHFGYNSRFDVDKYIEYVKEINSLVLDNYYSRYKTISNDELEKERLEILEKYKTLKLKGIEEKKRLEKITKWVNGATTVALSFKHRIAKNGGPAMYDVAIGDSVIPGFDIAYKEAAMILDASSYSSDLIGVYNNKHVYEDAQKYVDEMIEKLETMNPNEYRKYKIDQMMLSPEQIELFDQHISEYMMNDEKTSGRSM